MSIRSKTTVDKQGYNSSIETIFSEFLVLDIVEREAALKKLNEQQPALVAEVESLLLAAEEAKDFLSYSPVSAFSELEPDEKSWIGLKIGAYQIIRELGRGGMGTVFLAERADGEYQKQVAIKLVNRVINTKWVLSHFKAERQILASLEHPNIGSLLDGGTTEDGYPYLVMEYIQGLPIDSYCQTRHLTIKEKLEIFIKVCNAVQYAHQNHIVHRDLKPVNILITEEGIPKLLDFGIAKLLGSEETSWKNNPKMLLDFPMLTPEYASPEQLLGDTITILSDVYALGVILYELISGQRPYKFPSNNIANIAQIICDKQILPPSRCLPELRSQLKGDLDNIILFALRKEPEFRYKSVRNLSTDIQHYLQGKPVKATVNSFSYRFTKFVKRNKIGASLSGIALSILLIGIFISSWQWQIAQAELKRANRHYKDIRGLANTMVFDVSDSIAKLPGSTQLRRTLIDKGAVYLERLAQQHRDDPELQNEVARAFSKLALVEGVPVRENLGKIEDAQESLNKSLIIWETLVVNDPENLPAVNSLARVYRRMSGIYAVQGNYKQALNLTNQCITLLEKSLLEKPNRRDFSIIACYALAAHWLSTLGNYPQARKNLFTAQEKIEKLKKLSMFPFKLRKLQGRVHEELAEVASKTGDMELAVENERKRLFILQKLPGNQCNASLLADAYQGLAARVAVVGENDYALQVYHQGLTIWSERARKYPEDIRPRQGMAGIYAELSKLHLVLANKMNENKNSNNHKKIACDFYQHSQELIDKLPEPGVGFGIRYSWLLNPEELLRSLAFQC